MHRRVSLSAFVGVLLQRDRSIAGRLFVAAKGDALFVQKIRVWVIVCCRADVYYQP